MLRNLETFVADKQSCILPGQLIDILLESCCNPETLKHLYLHDKSNSSRDDHPYFSRLELNKFPKLETFYGVLSEEDLERFQKLSSLPRLKKINWTIREDENAPRELELAEKDDEFCHIHLYWKTLEIFKNTLVDVCLSVSGDFYKADLSFRMDLPKLRKLELVGYGGPLVILLQLGSYVLTSRPEVSTTPT